MKTEAGPSSRPTHQPPPQTSSPPKPLPDRPFGISVLHLLLAVLLVTWLIPAPPPVLNLGTGRAFRGVGIRPVDPFLRDVLEPLYGPIHLFSRLPDRRDLSLIVWIAFAWFGFRLWQRARRKELRRNLGREIRFLFGLYVPLALFPLPFLWIGVIPRHWQKLLTPVGLPFLVFGILLLRVLLSRRTRGRRWRETFHLSAVFVGIPGFVAIAIFAAIFVIPGVWRTGLRFVAPPGKVLMDLHAHSQTSQDAIVGGVRRLDIFRDHGVTVSAVTEHNTFFDRRDPTDYTFATLKRPAQERGIELLPGEEFTTHAVHLVLLGIRHTYNPSKYRTSGDKGSPPDFGYDYPRLIAKVHRAGGKVIVAHWGTIRQWDRIPWRTLISWGVDGFEIATGADRATPEQLAAWKKTGLLLVAATDFHGWRKSIYCVNLEDSAIVSSDPYETVRRIFRGHPPTVLAANTYDPRVPAWLDPPVSVFRYLTGMRTGGRISWLVLLLLIRLFVPVPVGEERPRETGSEGSVVGTDSGGRGAAPVVQ